MVRNIIEDSDDEGDFGALSPIASRKSSPAPIHQPNEKTPTRSQKSLPGTGSTEELRREIAAAHKDVIDKSAAPNGTADSADNTTPPGSPAGSHKRKSTLSSLDSHGTPRTKRTDRKKSAKTYGQPDRRDYSLFGEGDNAFEAMKQDETERHRGNHGDLAYLDEDEPPPQTSEEYSAVYHQATLPKMPSSLQEDFAGHEPAVMFPMTMSSTIPDATLDQQRLLEAVRTEYQQNQCPSSSRIAAKLIENPSVSWSDSLEGNERAMQPSQHSIGKSQQPHHGSTSQSQSLKPRASREAGSQPLDNGSNPSSTPRSRAAAKRSRTTPYSRTYQSSWDELGEHDELGEESLPTTSKASPRQGRSSRVGDSPTKSQRVVEQSIQESIRAVRASKVKKAQETNTSDALNSDDLAIGFPKERYVPRPSRSRSVRSPVEEPDYMVKPEKAAKQKAKRRKTGDVTAVQGQNNSKVEPMFTKETSASAKEESAAPLVDIPLSAPEKAQSNAPTQKRKRGRPPRKRQEDASNTTADERHAAGVTEKSQVDEVGKLHQVMPSAGENPEREQFAHAEQLLHDPDFKDDGLHARHPSPVVQPSPASSARVVGEVQQVEEPKQRRRGRDRPRSVQNKVRGAAATDVDELQTATEAPPYYENEKSQEIRPDTGLEDGESHDFQKTEEGVEKATLGAADDAVPALGSSRSSEKPSEKHEVGAKQKAAAKGGSAEPSPLGKGKVPVRVGLSRRARIAPLLKIVKK